MCGTGLPARCGLWRRRRHPGQDLPQTCAAAVRTASRSPRSTPPAYDAARPARSKGRPGERPETSSIVAAMRSDIGALREPHAAAQPLIEHARRMRATSRAGAMLLASHVRGSERILDGSRSRPAQPAVQRMVAPHRAFEVSSRPRNRAIGPAHADVQHVRGANRRLGVSENRSKRARFHGVIKSNSASAIAAPSNAKPRYMDSISLSRVGKFVGLRIWRSPCCSRPQTPAPPFPNAAGRPARRCESRGAQTSSPRAKCQTAAGGLERNQTSKYTADAKPNAHRQSEKQ